MNPSLGQHQKWTIVILFLGTTLLVGCGHGQSTGNRCYTCSSAGDDMTCVTNPTQAGGATTVVCDREDGQGFGWCLVQRQEYNDMPGKVVSFIRTCLKTQPTILDDVITDTQFTNYIRTCRTHLCNIGDGIASYDTSDDIVGGSGGRPPIIVAAEDAAFAPYSNIPLLTGLLFLLYCLLR